MHPAIFLVLLIFGGGQLALGTQCLSGSPNNRTFLNALQNSPTPLMTQFRATSAISFSEGQVGCINGNCPSQSQQLLNLPRTLTEIPKDCIRASLNRKISQSSMECIRKSNGNWEFARHPKGSKNTPCIDEKTVDYTHFVTNKVLSCFQGLNLPGGGVENIDTKMFYAKINNESGFNFSYSYAGGTGIGQLTSWAVREMNVINSQGTPGRGRPILDAILNSGKSECQDIKHIIADDLRFRYQYPRQTNQTCEWVSMETGLAKGLIYSLGYFAHLKHNVIGAELRRLAPHVANDPEALNMLTMVAYGPNGTNRAKEMIYEHRMNVRATSLDYIKSQIKKEKYVKATLNRLSEVKKMQGASCRLL